MLCVEPVASATTDTTEAMPMMMPSIVRKVRRRCAAIDTQAIVKASPIRSRRLLTRCCVTAAFAVPRAAGSPGSDALVWSDTITPSRISMMRGACIATLGSWVTRMTVWPSRFSSARIVITSSPERVSSAPVGSSARITSAAVHQRTRNAHPLLLPAGELAGTMAAALGQSQPFQQLRGAGPPHAPFVAGVDGRYLDIAARGQVRQQVVALENETEMLAAQLGQFVRRQLSHVRPFTR